MKNIFKVLAIIFIAVIGFSFVACGGDDDGGGKTEVNLAVPTLTISGTSAHWTPVSNANTANGYTIKIDTTENIVTGTTYDLSTLVVGNYQISVKTNGYETGTHIYKASNYSDEKPYNVTTAHVQYTITYNDTYGLTNNNQTTYTTASETITFSALTGTRTGYTFSGWNPASIPTGSTGNKTITAQWTANQYTITYKDVGDTTFSGTHGANHPTTHTYGTATALVTPTKTDYIFGGWFTNSGGTGSAITSLSETGYTANITLYAKWTSGNFCYGIMSQALVNQLKMERERR